MHRDTDPLHPSFPTLHSPGSDLDGRHCQKSSSTDPLLKGKEQQFERRALAEAGREA